MYRVEIHREAKKEIDSLPEHIKEKIIELLVNLQRTPYPYHEYDLKKLKSLTNVYRIRLGNYRVSYYVDDNSKVVIILEVKIRGGAYKEIKRRLP